MKPIILSILLVAAFGFFFYNIYRLVRLLSLGKMEKRWDRIPERIKALIVYVFGQKRLVKNYTFAGTEHFIIFWGFLIITIGTIELLVGGLVGGFQILPGKAHNVFEFVLDIVQTLVVVAIFMGFVNRFTIGKRREVNAPDAFVILCLILSLMVTSLAYSAAKVALGQADSAWMPISTLLSTVYSGMSEGDVVYAREFFWWFHILIVLGFLNYLPYSKHSHVITALPNVFFQNLEPRGALRPINFEDETLERYGSAKLTDFTWKDILDAYTCTECGRCTDNCPAWNTEKPLSPRDIVVKLRHYASFVGRKAISTTDQESLPDIPSDDWVTPEELWACTTCNACVEQCPLFIDQMGKIVEMRRYLTMQGKLSGTAVRTLQKLQSHGNPWGFEPAERASWVAEFEDVNVLGVNVEGDASGFDVIYWMGCFGAYDPRGQKVAKTIVSLLKEAGVNFALLGPMETCTGDPARRLGEEALFQMLASQNIETMNELKVKKIVTNCPHCFNTIKNEYPQFGGHYEVVNHTDFLLSLIEQGKLAPKGEARGKVTYHDSCYLGRYNNIYDSPREILKRIPGVSLLEMKRSGANSFCCGAGGGKIWMEEEAPRVNWNRFDEAASLNPDTIATACYFCTTMFDDAAKFRDKAQDISIRDVAEILSDSVEAGKK
ncbi:MAG: (Fe-S)-binding protein [Candidatus Methanosuratincola sp.]|jgi:Fe-S oxidoreductase/nitrate reductase gamma subunit